MKKDKREINEIWEHTNPLGERYEYARVGSGKNSYTKTLRYLGKKRLRKEILKAKTTNKYNEAILKGEFQAGRRLILKDLK